MTSTNKMLTSGCNVLLAVLTLTLVIPSGHGLDEFTSDGWFYRTHSGLTDVPDDIPKEAVGVYLNNNYITKLTANVFSHLSAVKFMSLSENAISEIEPMAFMGMMSLNEIWLGDNSLTGLKRGSFYGLENLKSLVLSNNNINTTEDDSFTGLKNLENLFLYGNSFTTLRAKMFSGLDALQKIILTYNHISAIEIGAFTGLINLRELWMDHNNEKLKGMRNMTFIGLSSLELLYVHNNEIESIEAGLFNGLQNLKEIGLDDNEITEIKPGAFQGMESLSKVWMYNNKLTSLDADVFIGLPRNLEITLGGNPLKCDSALCWLKRLEKDGYITWIQLEDRPLYPQCEGGTPWRNLTLGCTVEVECSDPGGVAGAVRSGAKWPYTVNTVFNYTCDKCHTGGGSITCQGDGTWTQKPECKINICNVTGAYLNGTETVDVFRCGHRTSCPDGWEVQGDPVIICTPDGKVVGPHPYCQLILTTTDTSASVTGNTNNSTAKTAPLIEKKNDSLDLVLIIIIVILLLIIIFIVIIVICLKRKRGTVCCGGFGGSEKVKDGTVVYPPAGWEGCEAAGGVEPDAAGGFTNPGAGAPPVNVADTEMIIDKSADSEL